MKNSFENLSLAITHCSKCPLRSTCSRVVVGSGVKRTEILFVGEAPGKKEDELGVPFVGASGKLLDKMLSSINLDRNSVYITNIVKCRPPANRDPSPEEIQTCTQWLVEQVNSLEPKLIVTLGRHSMNFFLPHLRISSAHGHVHRAKPTFLKRSMTFFTLYHPAAALYNGGLRQTLFQDFSRIPKIVSGIEKEN